METNIKAKTKIDRKIRINNMLNNMIFQRKESEINLKNYLTDHDINEIDKGIDSILTSLIYLDNYITVIDDKDYEVKLSSLEHRIKYI